MIVPAVAAMAVHLGLTPQEADRVWAVLGTEPGVVVTGNPSLFIFAFMRSAAVAGVEVPVKVKGWDS